MQFWMGIVGGAGAVAMLGFLGFMAYIWLDVFVSAKIAEAMKETADVLAETNKETEK
jgi:hypothetical protein